MITSKELREERGGLVKQMQDLIVASNERDDPGMLPEEQERFDKLDAAQEKLTGRAEQIEKVEKIDIGGQEVDAISLANMPIPDVASEPKQRTEVAEQEARAFSDYLRGRGGVPTANLSTEDRGWAMKLATSHGGREERATTAQTITTTGGGHTVPNELMREMEEALASFGGMREVSTVIRTDSGATLPIPTVNDSTEVATILAINGEGTVKDIGFGQKTFTAYKYTSGIVLVPQELMEDTAIDLASFIGRALGSRVARGTNAHFTTGESTDSQPQGVVGDTVAGVTAATRNTVTYAELLELLHSVDPAYRASPSCRWMFSDTTFKRIRTIVDGDSRPLWQPGLAGIAGGPQDTLLGYPYTINQDVASMSTTAGAARKAILFGAFDRYWIRDVRDVVLRRLDERYATLAQTAFLTFSRHDGGVVIASTGNRPISHLITST